MRPSTAPQPGWLVLGLAVALAVVDQTMEPTTVSLWLRPPVERAQTS
jgi:hypothetical protein